MKAEGRQNAAVVSCFLDLDWDVSIARGHFDRLFSSYRKHAHKWIAPPGEDVETMMVNALAAATLDLALRPPDEFTAWTLNIKDPPLNFFCCGDNAEFIVTGRAFTRDVQTADSSRLFVESHRPKRKPTQSSVDVDGLDVLDIFGQFYDRSEQLPSRFHRIQDDEFALIRGLPKVDQEWLRSLDARKARSYLRGDFTRTDERIYRFRCGCNFKTILKVVRSMYKHNAEELFLGEEKVEVSCPRCGRRWWLTRKEFGVGPQKLGVT
jgi:molecular chaperone Hsp33